MKSNPCSRQCTHYTSSSEGMVGAYSDCGEEGGQMGYLNDLQKILEIKPLDKKYSEKFSATQDTPSNQLHIVVRRDASDATEHAKSK